MASTVMLANQLTPEEEATLTAEARFVVLQKADGDASFSQVKKRSWFKDARLCWDRVSANKAKPQDLASVDLVFALKHRVCGEEPLVRGYIQGSSYDEQDLLTYQGYLDKSCPSWKEESANLEKLLIKKKPRFTLEELIYLAANVNRMVKVNGPKRLNAKTLQKCASNRSVGKLPTKSTGC